MTDTLQDFNIDMGFFIKISSLSDVSLLELYEKLHDCCSILPKDDDYTMGVYGVLKEEEVFFELEFMNREGDCPIFLDIEIVDLETYLDAIDEDITIEQLIKYEKNEQDISLREGED